MGIQITRLIEYIKDRKLDAILISKPENRLYFSGFSGSSGMLLVSETVRILVTDFRYIEQAQDQAEGFQVQRFSGSPFPEIAKVCISQNLTRIGFEADDLTYEMFQQLNKQLGTSELIPAKPDSLRSVKTEEELQLIRKAVEISDQAFEEIIAYIKPGVREIEIAAELEYTMRRLGSERPAFETIVASGKRGALPHGLASEKRIEAGDFVTMDFGAVFNRYHSDITRTVVVGKASDKQKEIYNIVLAAQLAGLAAVKPGEACLAVDKTARDIIVRSGYGDYFGHGLGHGVGLAIHEEPRLSPSNTDGVLEQGMVVTVEPGIYLPGWGGVRIEDTVVVCPTGREVLTSSSKTLIELG